jgi:hypothetical protein
MGCGSDQNNHFYNPQTKSWIDKPKKDDLYNQYWDIADNGDIFTIAINDFNKLIHYKYGGLDQFNNPIWDAANATVTTISEYKWVRRVSYETDEDAMYLCGEQNADDNASFLKVKKFPNWSTGNRASVYTKDLPYNEDGYAGRNYGGGIPRAFAVAGDYLFFCYGIGHIRIMKRSDGELVGTIVQDMMGWKGSDGQVDAAYGLTAFKRANGEYILLFENAGWANIMMIRWCPGTCTNAPDVVIPEPEDTTGAAIHPSPARTGLLLKQGTGEKIIIHGLVGRNSAVSVCDLSGRIVFEGTVGSQNATVNLGRSSKGLYVVNIKDAAGTKSQKIGIR